MNPTPESYAQIVRDLARLRASLSMAFESDEAEYECSAVMTEAEVREFERAHAVRLPEEYRAFLRCVPQAEAEGCLKEHAAMDKDLDLDLGGREPT